LLGNPTEARRSTNAPQEALGRGGLLGDIAEGHWSANAPQEALGRGGLLGDIAEARRSTNAPQEVLGRGNLLGDIAELSCASLSVGSHLDPTSTPTGRGLRLPLARRFPVCFLVCSH
jgi:hypothetical protein